MPVNGFGRWGVMVISVNDLLYKLKENYIDNIDFIALMEEGKAKIIFFDNSDIGLFWENMLFIKSNNKALILKTLSEYEYNYLSLSTDLDLQFLKKNHRLFLTVNNWVYTSKVKFDMAAYDIRRLNESHIEYLNNHHSSSRDYLLYCLKKGMYGYFINDKIVAFIGMHEEFSMGLLYVEERYRRLNIGFLLEAYLINKLIDENRVAYCQVSIDNIASQNLQKKLGLHKSNRLIYWFDRLEVK